MSKKSANQAVETALILVFIVSMAYSSLSMLELIKATAWGQEAAGYVLGAFALLALGYVAYTSRK